MSEDKDREAMAAEITAAHRTGVLQLDDTHGFMVGWQAALKYARQQHRRYHMDQMVRISEEAGFYDDARPAVQPAAEPQAPAAAACGATAGGVVGARGKIIADRPAADEPVYHLRSYGDVSAAELKEYTKQAAHAYKEFAKHPQSKLELPAGWRIKQRRGGALALYQRGTAQPTVYEPGEVVHTLLTDMLPADPLCPTGELWDLNPDGLNYSGEPSGPRMNRHTGEWEGAEADEDEDAASSKPEMLNGLTEAPSKLEAVAWYLYLPSQQRAEVYLDADDPDLVEELTNSSDAELRPLCDESALLHAIRVTREACIKAIEPEHAQEWTDFDHAANACADELRGLRDDDLLKRVKGGE